MGRYLRATKRPGAPSLSQAAARGLLVLLFATTTMAVSWRGALASDRSLSVEEQAALLQRVTVTLRVTLSEDEVQAASNDAGEDEASPRRAARVSVCSGVLLENGFIVSSVYAGTDSKIRITLPGGRQADARLCVIDGYSGLVLLRISQNDLAGIPLAEKTPAVGRTVMTAAAWGTQEPVVSRGIVSGVGRTLSGVSFPPLLQCDLRTAETASGAGIVDASGRLLGIVVLADQQEQRRGWTYAVPANHVQRLVRTHESRRDASSPTAPSTDDSARSVIVLKRRRPVVGMVLGGGADEIRVRRVEPGSPADRAGIRVGDRILAADGVQIRSVYQAVRPVLFKQPGDLMRYLVDGKDGQQEVAVKLGGGVELPSATLENLGQYVRPKIDIEGLAVGRFRAVNARGEVREVNAAAPEAGGETDDRPVTNAKKIEILERALDAYRNVIDYQRRELGRRESERKQLETELQSLQKQLKELRGSP